MYMFSQVGTLIVLMHGRVRVCLSSRVKELLNRMDRIGWVTAADLWGLCCVSGVGWWQSLKVFVGAGGVFVGVSLVGARREARDMTASKGDAPGRDKPCLYLGRVAAARSRSTLLIRARSVGDSGGSSMMRAPELCCWRLGRRATASS